MSKRWPPYQIAWFLNYCIRTLYNYKRVDYYRYVLVLSLVDIPLWCVSFYYFCYRVTLLFEWRCRPASITSHIPTRMSSLQLFSMDLVRLNPTVIHWDTTTVIYEQLHLCFSPYCHCIRFIMYTRVLQFKANAKKQYIYLWTVLRTHISSFSCQFKSINLGST